jgi:hypothetical protein
LPKCCSFKKPEDTYTVTIKKTGMLGESATSDEVVDKNGTKPGNTINFRDFKHQFEYEGDDDAKFTITVYKKNFGRPDSSIASVTYEPDVSALGTGIKVPLKGRKFGENSHIYCAHYIKQRPSKD